MMDKWCLRLLRILLAVLLASGFAITSHGHNAAAAAPETIPIKAGILVDNANSNAGGSSALFQSVIRVLKVNRIPYETLDISAGQHYQFADASSSPRYAVLIILANGARIDTTNSQSIMSAVNLGMGAAALQPDCVNSTLMNIFGITSIGSGLYSTAGVRITRDEFTYAYAGETIQQSGNYSNHQLAAGTISVASASGASQSTLWTYNYGAGKTVFHNFSGSSVLHYQGALMQSILYAMPVGVSCPINAGVIEVDDSPRTYYEADYTQKYYWDFINNLKRWLDAYNMTASAFLAFSYSNDIADFWLEPESLAGVNDYLKAGIEVGLHCGSTHEPHTPTYWGGAAGLNTEVDKIAQEIKVLQERVQSAYGITLGDIISYVAPMNVIETASYPVLGSKTDIKYVGVQYAPGAQADSSIDTQTIANDDGLAHLYAQKNIDRRSIVSPAAEYPNYPTSYRDFGYEPGSGLYNLPRAQGDFLFFNLPQDNGEYYYAWALFRCMVESGTPYLIFTHPDEADILNGEGYPGTTMADVFEAYAAWADKAAADYPFYRWWTAGKLGDFMTSRSGTLDAVWLPGEKVLRFEHTQTDEPIQFKTSLYLSGISHSGTTYEFQFTDIPTIFQTTEFDIVQTGQNYFIYPPGSSAYLPVIPSTPFIFAPYTPPPPGNQAPVLASIGNRTITVGQLLTFTVTATDANNDTLTYSATNLPSGASFNTNTHVFSWTPLATGSYANIRFEVSDGELTDFENITITVAEPSTGGEMTKTVAANADDGFSGSWGFYNNLSWYEVGVPYNAWYRFTGITIPAGATITEAYLQTTQTRWDSGTKLIISAEDAANPAAPANSAGLNSKVRTTAGIAWTSGYTDWAYHNSPNIAAVIQELINSYSYNNGVIQILVNNNGSTGSAEAVGQSFESGNAPRLYIKYTVPLVNQAPVLNPINNKTVTIGHLLNFTVTATDANTGDILTYSATNLPDGATFNAATHSFSWSPAAEGTFAGIHFEVSDGKLSDAEDISITVNPNNAPVLESIGDKIVDKNTLLQFIINAADADNDSLTYSAADLPAGAVFDAATRAFSWTPAVAGPYPGVKFEVTDGQLTDAETITITVNEPVNHPPVLASINTKTVNKGQPLTFTVSATDPDGNALTYSAANLPAGATFNAATRTFNWTPDAAGTYPNIHFEVSDGDLIDYEEITITVTDIPPVPVEITKSVTAGVDDGFSGTWGFYNNLNWYEVGVPYNSWYRFTGITIPAGAVITEAYLQTSQTQWASGTKLRIRAEKLAGPAAPTSTANHSSKAGTTAYVDWTAGSSDWTYHNSPNLAAVIQELVNSYSYNNGVIQILVDNNGSTGSAEAVGQTFESGNAPRLYIKYTPGTPQPNQPPVLASIGNKTASKEQNVTFVVSASDPDSSSLTYSAANLPSGANFNTSTHIFSWTPAAAGTYAGVHFEVSDGSLTDFEDITITVNEAVNNPPVLNSIGNKAGTVGQLITFTITATDPDGNALTYSAANLPNGANFNAATRSFSWNPATAGTFSGIRFTVSDGTLTDFEDITITITAATSGNTTGTVASTPVPSGAGNEYNLFLNVTSSTISGVTPGQQVWLAATTTDFPNLLTVGATLSGNLDHSLGWWVFKKAASP